MLTQLTNRLKARFTSDLKQIDWSRTLLLIALILAYAAALWQYAMPTVRTITTTEFRRVPEIRKTVEIKRVHVPCPESGIIILDKAEVAKKLKFDFLPGGDIAGAKSAAEVTSPSPQGTQSAANLQITATADLPESDNGYESVSLIDLSSGESQIMAREKESPWFQFRSDAAVGIRYGLCAGTDSASPYCGDVYGRWDFLRVKDVYLSTNANISTDGSARIQLGAEYRW